jgi:DNA invertase Pin-like site-specific DNA recombinase
MSSHADCTDALAYSYLRFSDPHQSKGDSVRRQDELRDDWLKRNPGVRLDTSVTLQDRGKSAFTGEHRKNPDRHALAAFLKLVDSGKVPRGSYLLIENLDRLSREHEVPACHLLTGILMAGIQVVQLSPYEMLLTDKSNGWELMRAVMELSRGHGESAMKSERIGKAWAAKKARARRGEPQVSRSPNVNGMKLLTHILPSWVEERGGKLVLIPGRAAAVRRMFQLSAAGYGSKRIASVLTREGVAAFGRALTEEDVASWPERRLRQPESRRKPPPTAGEVKALRGQIGTLGCWDCGEWVPARWNGCYVWTVLTDRRAVGEYQPRLCKRGRKPDGPPVPGFFPPAVTEAEWLAAQAGIAQRRSKPGRADEHINIFAGLLRDARSGSTYVCKQVQPSNGRGSRHRVLINRDALERLDKCYTFPFVTFERTILFRLAEVDPHDILNGDQGPDESQVLAGEWERLESSLHMLNADMDAHGESPTLMKRVRELEARQADVSRRLTEARQRAAHPLSEAWGQAQSLLAVLDSAPDPDDARLRLRSSLRRIVADIWLLVVPRGCDRLAAVQIWFTGYKRHRSYVILHRPPRSNGKTRKKGLRKVGFLPDVARIGEIDLRKRNHLPQVERWLTEVDVGLLQELLKDIDLP